MYTEGTGYNLVHAALVTLQAKDLKICHALNVQCGAGATCLLQIWSGADSTGVLLATYNSTNPVPASKIVTLYSSKIYVKYTATDPAVRFIATWVCAQGEQKNPKNYIGVYLL